MQEHDGGMERAWQTIAGWYAAPGAEQACLALQDQAGFGVTTGLALLWLAATDQGAVNAAGLAELETATAYREQVLVPLRQARRGLKGWEWRLDTPATELRRALLRNELEAERLELRLVLDALMPEASRTRSGDPCGDACLSLARYLRANDVNLATPALHQHLLHLLCIALEDYDSLQVEAVLRLALERVRRHQ